MTKPTADELLAEVEFPDASQVEPAAPDPDAGSCWVDLGPYLDGTYSPPVPEVGAQRRPDGKYLLYPGKSHLLTADTGIGKTWFACVHVAAELLAGSTVVYAHFEEPRPDSTVARLLRLGVPAEVIAAGLKWADTDRMETYAEDLAALDPAPRLVILDGVGAACGGRSINEPETVNWYRAEYVIPATRLGAAVLSITHPVKDPARASERHAGGSGFWLNLVDGVGLRMIPGKPRITRGGTGTASIYSVKDRDGGVEQGEPEGKYEGWRWLGTLKVEDLEAANGSAATRAVILAPSESEAKTEAPRDEVAELAEAIVMVLAVAEGHRYETQRQLTAMMRDQHKVKFRDDDLGAALERLERLALIEREPYAERKARPGWLTEAGLSAASRTASERQEVDRA